MEVGIDPLRLLLLKLRWVRFGNEVKLKFSSVPARFELERFMLVIVPAELQRMPVQLQRFLRLVRDHELREEDDGDKLFLHLTRASACVAADDLISNGRQTRKRRRKRRIHGF